MRKIFFVSLLVFGVFASVAFIFGGMLVSFSNQEVALRNKFTQGINTRTSFYDKMWKTISGKAQVALKNDSSFARNVNVIMEGRKDAPQLFMKWVTETNPNANFTEVSKLYQELSQTIEAERDGFFMQEKTLQDIVLQHSNHIGQFPGSLINGLFFHRDPLVYKPITSDRTDDVMESGKDNNVNVF
jgi:hypothetical protein